MTKARVSSKLRFLILQKPPSTKHLPPNFLILFNSINNQAMDILNNICSPRRLFHPVILGLGFLSVAVAGHRDNNTLPSSTHHRGNDTLGLLVTIQQTSTTPTLNITVTNTNDKPVTFLEWNSPLNDRTLYQAQWNIIPENSTKRFNITRRRFRRPQLADLEKLAIELNPGESRSNEISFLEDKYGFPSANVTWLRALGKRPRVSAQGYWYYVWMKPKAEFFEPSGRWDLPAKRDRLSGRWHSNEIQMILDI